MAPPLDNSNNNNKKKSVVIRQSSHSSVTEILLGGIAVGSFVVIWVSSLLSPFLLYLSIRYEFHLGTTVVLLMAIAAYTPWSGKGVIAKSVNRFFDHYHPLYYRSVSIVVTTKTDDDKTTDSSSNSNSNESDDEKEEKKKKSKTFYAVHPHGAFCFGWSVLFCSSAFEHVRFCFSPFLYNSPFFRLFSRLTGNPGYADKASMVSYMKQGQSIALPPGGFEEATITSPHHDRVYIRKRAGFIKLCLQHGYDVVPVYCFGEKDTFWNLQGAWKLRLACNAWGLPAIVVWGHPVFPWVPKQSTDLHVVAGEPVVLPQIAQPTREDVQEWHGKYMEALTQVFEEHKERAYGKEYGEKAKLELW